LGLKKVAAERFDTLLPLQEQKENVGNMSAEGGENECRPCMIKGRTFSKVFSFV